MISLLRILSMLLADLMRYVGVLFVAPTLCVLRKGYNNLIRPDACLKLTLRRRYLHGVTSHTA